MFVHLVLSPICAAATVMSNNYCSPEGNVVCSADHFKICASGVWSIKMSLAQGTTCGIFNKNVSPASLDSPTSIKSDHLFGDAKVISQSGYDIPVPSGVPDSQITTSLTSSATQVSSGARPKVPTRYSGPASDFPPSSLWVSFRFLWSLNRSVCELNPEGTPQLINNAIRQVASDSGVDARVIFAVVLQESTCLLSAVTPANYVGNSGLMQSHNGVGYTNKASIMQMIKDGTEGTHYQGVNGGDGLQQLISKYGVYGGLRAYNSGEHGIDINNLSSAAIGTPSYVSDVANRLIGVIVAH
jgi:hypothetical protein